MMQIQCIVSSNPFYESTAGANRIRGLIEGLLSNGIKCEFLIYGGLNTSVERENCYFEYNNPNLVFTYLTDFVQDTLWKRRFYKYVYSIIDNLLIKNKLLKLVNDNKQIIWVSNDLFLFQFFHVLKAKNPSLKLFMEISEYFDFYKSQNIPFYLLKQYKKHENYFNNIFINDLSACALMTKNIFSQFDSYKKENLSLLHLPMTVDFERFNGSKDILDNFKSPYIAFVGVMDNKKDGVSILIEAFHKIKYKYPNYSVYLVGGWNYDTPQHLKLINEFQLTDRVHWMKEYPRDLIPNIICNADLLVLPRPDSKQAQGGFPTKLGEYLASGVPVCATTVGEIPDYLVDNESVFFAEPGSIESFAEAMDRALSDPVNAKRVGLNGRKVAEKEFNKDIQAKKLYEFLKTL